MLFISHIVPKELRCGPLHRPRLATVPPWPWSGAALRRRAGRPRLLRTVRHDLRFLCLRPIVRLRVPPRPARTPRALCALVITRRVRVRNQNRGQSRTPQSRSARPHPNAPRPGPPRYRPIPSDRRKLITFARNPLFLVRLAHQFFILCARSNARTATRPTRDFKPWQAPRRYFR